MNTHDKLFKIELCKKKAAFTAKPQKNLSLNLDILKEKFGGNVKISMNGSRLLGLESNH